MVHAIISLFTIFLYSTLGIYVLAKNPHERSNKVFVLLMLIFILWAMGTYNLGLIAENAPLSELVLHMRLQLSGFIIALTLFVFFAIEFTKAKDAFKSPFTYLITAPSLYLLYIIWTSDVSRLERIAFSTMTETKPELFLSSTIFGVAGIYLLLRHYMSSKYRERGLSKLILTGAIAAILSAVIVNIILPMFFDVYLLELSTLAPAIMGIFFAYAVYEYGLFVRPKPEISVTSFCGIDCTLCPEYLDDECAGCRFDRERYVNCNVYKCVMEKGYKDCGDCHEIIECLKRREAECYGYMPEMKRLEYCMEPGGTYFVKDGYHLLFDAVSCGSLGIIATTSNPGKIKEEYRFRSTPIVWISDEAVEMGVKPDDVKRLSGLLINFMKKIGNAVVLLDGVDELVAVNGFEKTHWVVQILNSTARATKSCLIVSTDMEGENLSKLAHGMEYVKLDNV